MGAPRYTTEQDRFLLQLEREYGENQEEIHTDYVRKFPKPPRTVEHLWRHIATLHQRGATPPSGRKAVNGQLQRFTAWLERTVQSAEAHRAARDQLVGEVRKLREENRALKQANDQLAGQIAKFRRLAALVEGPMKSPRVESAKVQHSKD